MIEMKCPRCRETWAVPESLAGTKGYCPGCRYPLVVPAPPAPVSAINDAQDHDPAPGANSPPRYELLDAFAVALRVLGLLSLVAGIGLGVVSLFVTMAAAGGESAGLARAAAGFGLAVCGVAQAAIAELLLAVRDIAISTWALRFPTQTGGRP